MSETRREHWEAVYRSKDARTVSWFQESPRASLDLIAACAAPSNAPLVDVGAGASTLVDALLARGHEDITLLDTSEAALSVTRARLETNGAALDHVHFAVSDVTAWRPTRPYAVWHDRAVYHFLVEAADRALYREVLASALAPAGACIIGTFALDGPERCSGLPVRRQSAESIARDFEGLLRPVESRAELHTTPAGSSQSFVFVRFVRR